MAQKGGPRWGEGYKPRNWQLNYCSANVRGEIYIPPPRSPSVLLPARAFDVRGPRLQGGRGRGPVHQGARQGPTNRQEQNVTFGGGYNRPQPQQQANWQRPNNSRGNQRGSQAPQQAPKQQVDWRRAVEHDSTNEQPSWPFTCYSHIRSQPGATASGGSNDLEGDFSFAELRWAQMQAAAKGTPPQQLAQEVNAGKDAQAQQLQILSKARRPPAEGGPPIPPIQAFLPAAHSLLTCLGQQPAGHTTMPMTPFGQTVGAFGRNPSVAAQPSAFGAQMSSGNPFARQHEPAHPGAANAQQPGNPGFAAGPSQAFGSHQAQPGFAAPGLGVDSSAQALGMDTARGNNAADRFGGNLEGVSEVEKAWLATAFEYGKIPDSAPPPMYCR